MIVLTNIEARAYCKTLHTERFDDPRIHDDPNFPDFNPTQFFTPEELTLIESQVSNYCTDPDDISNWLADLDKKLFEAPAGTIDSYRCQF